LVKMEVECFIAKWIKNHLNGSNKIFNIKINMKDVKGARHKYWTYLRPVKKSVRTTETFES